MMRLLAVLQDDSNARGVLFLHVGENKTKKGWNLFWVSVMQSRLLQAGCCCVYRTPIRTYIYYIYITRRDIRVIEKCWYFPIPINLSLFLLLLFFFCYLRKGLKYRNNNNMSRFDNSTCVQFDALAHECVCACVGFVRIPKLQRKGYIMLF